MACKGSGIPAESFDKPSFTGLLRRATGVHSAGGIYFRSPRKGGQPMRKTLMLLLAGLAALLVATSVATADPNKSVTISASKPIVVYGHSVTLSGKITPPASNQKVDILAQPFGLSTVSAVSCTLATSCGEWDMGRRPPTE